jgi:hypothetical protein
MTFLLWRVNGEDLRSQINGWLDMNARAADAYLTTFVQQHQQQEQQGEQGEQQQQQQEVPQPQGVPKLADLDSPKVQKAEAVPDDVLLLQANALHQLIL